jgi:tRNA pseudouridine13 synthase
MRIGSLDKLETGDVAWKHGNGACFLVEDAATEQPRCDSLEISPTGPIFGRKMKRPAGVPDEMEQTLLVESGLELETIDSKGSGTLDGARRPLRVPLGEAKVSVGRDDRGEYLELVFFLPPGSYATSAVREVTKV